jgi:hypothetical protein
MTHVRRCVFQLVLVTVEDEAIGFKATKTLRASRALHGLLDGFAAAAWVR